MSSLVIKTLKCHAQFMETPPPDIGGTNSVSEYPVGALTLVVTAVGFYLLIYSASDIFLGTAGACNQEMGVRSLR